MSYRPQFVPSWAKILSFGVFILVLGGGYVLGNRSTVLFEHWQKEPPKLESWAGGTFEMDLLQVQLLLQQEQVDLPKVESAFKSLLSRPQLTDEQRGEARYQLSTLQSKLASSTQELEPKLELLRHAASGYQDVLDWLPREHPVVNQALNALAQGWLELKRLEDQVLALEFQKLAQMTPEALLEELKTSLQEDPQDMAVQRRRGWITRLIDQKTKNFPFFSPAP